MSAILRGINIVDTLQRPSNGTTSSVASFTLVPPKPKRRRLYAIVAIIVALALVAGTIVFVRARAAGEVAYTTTPVAQRDLFQTVTATGTVNPQNTISVGTQVSGTLSEVDVDYNSHVKKGQVLARIDPTTFQTAVDQANAQLAQAQAQADSAAASAAGGISAIGSAQANAQVTSANAQSSASTAQANAAAIATAQSNVTKDQAALQLAQATVTRDTQLLSQGYIAQSQADTDKSALVAAQSTLESANAALSQSRETASASASQAQAAQAQIGVQGYAISSAQDAAANEAAQARAAQAAVASAQSQVQTAQLNLQKTVITSPVDGTVVARDVSVGTTVAASLQTPTLFSIAQNLNKMEADLSVGEPDIGNVKVGDGVDFTVLAYPNQTFHGTVSQVRINPVVTTNVVTYTTVVTVDNKDGKLLPGMTANATIDVAKAQNALVVPVTALSYQPAFNGQHRTRGNRAAGGNAANGNANASAATGANASTTASPWGTTTAGAGANVAAGSGGRIFVLRNGKPVRVNVNVALTDGTNAAVTPADGATLTTSDQVITSDSSARVARTATNANAARNPLAGVGGAGGGFGGNGGGRGR